MKKFFGIYLILVMLAIMILSIQATTNLANAQSGARGAGFGLPASGPPAGVVPAPAAPQGGAANVAPPEAIAPPPPEIPLKCWGCVPSHASCPKGEVCTKEHDCEDCKCDFVPKGYTSANRKHCTTIYEDAETPIGCYCIYCNY